MSACFGRCLLPKVVKIAGLWAMLYSGEKTTGYASGASGGSTPIVLPRWQLPPYHGGAEGRLRRPRGAGATGRIAHRTRAGIARATWRGYRSVAGRRRAARPKGRSARCPGCRPAPGWWGGAPAPTTHAPAPGSRPGAAAGDVVGRPGGQERDHAARAAPGAGGPCGQGPDDVGEGPPRGHRRP